MKNETENFKVTRKKLLISLFTLASTTVLYNIGTGYKINETESAYQFHSKGKVIQIIFNSFLAIF